MTWRVDQEHAFRSIIRILRRDQMHFSPRSAEISRDQPRSDALSAEIRCAPRRDYVFDVPRSLLRFCPGG
eukprot:CAMPEP_0119366016 /NCGR_PEP_ID=MMETSP1334-20130426/12899_1 /TAXON_ID=127549 /ORGANISM="Calcidiscus leptoporus, Strain RCC1130" /LENGTH=69 /DNA_ID=CAMNT_0007382121 /DNA_START=132 /DNA_END=341 /DNA_ORIENTATION=+